MTRIWQTAALILALSLVAAACGGDDDSSDGDSSGAATPTTTAAPDSGGDSDSGSGGDEMSGDDDMTDDEMSSDDEMSGQEMSGDDDMTDDDDMSAGEDEMSGDDMAEAGTLVVGQPDINGDGRVVIGIASPGDTNDGGYYQSFVQGARGFVDEAGWELIVADFINPAESESAMADLARQGIDFLAVGATELQDGLDAIACTEEFGSIAMYISATLAIESECYGQSSDDYFQIYWATGVAMAQLLERTGGTKAGFIGGPELAFSTNAHRSLEAGLKSVIPDAELVVTHTGDFNDAALGIEAARAMLDQDVGVIHAFLGGAMFPTGGFVASQGGMALSASTNTCFPGSPFVGSALFPPGEYLVANLRDFANGEYREGVIREFVVGIDPEVGVVLCDATPEEQAAIDEVVAMIGSGELVPEDFVGSG